MKLIKILNFFKKNIFEIKKNPKIILTKIITLKKLLVKLFIFILELPLYIILIPAIILILLFSRVYKIRFGIIRSRPFGNCILGISLIKLFKTLEQKKSLDLFFHDKEFINKQLLNFTKKSLFVSYFFKYFYHLAIFFNIKSLLFPSIEKLTNEFSFYKDKKRRFANFFPYFNFNSDENEKGFEFIKKYGLKRDSKFICIILRDSKYKQSLKDGVNYDYHSFRNVDIENYREAILKLIENGYWVFRMGSVAEKKLEIDSIKFIDYPFLSSKNDFLDIWLMANCHFCITSGTGLDFASICFGKPIIYTNLIEYKAPFFFFGNDLAIFKKIKSEKTNKILNISQIKKKNLFNIMSNDTLIENNLTTLENNSEEITQVVLEMHTRLEKISKKHSWDNQREFWNKFLEKDNLNFKTRIGKHYFERNFHWLNN